MMQSRLIVGVVVAWLGLAARAGDNPAFTPNATNRFAITGMSCDGCARGIASELKRAPGVAWAEVTFSNRLAVVGYDTNRITADALKKVIKEAGYGAKLVKTKNHVRR